MGGRAGRGGWVIKWGDLKFYKPKKGDPEISFEWLREVLKSNNNKEFD